MSVIINNKVISFICMGHRVPAHTGVRASACAVGALGLALSVCDQYLPQAWWSPWWKWEREGLIKS